MLMFVLWLMEVLFCTWHLVLYVLHSFPACHTVESSARAKPLGSSMHLHVKEIRGHHHEGRPVLLYSLSFFVCSLALLTCFMVVTPLLFMNSCGYIFRTVFSIFDMEIVQSAEDTGGIIGRPTQCKGAGMASLTACSKTKEVKSNGVNGPLWYLVFFAGKSSPEPELPSSTSFPTASAPLKTNQFDSKPGPSQRPDCSEFKLL